MTKRTLVVGVVAGAAAGLAMAAVEMIYGWASSAHTAWDAPMGIWAYIGGLNHFGRPVDHIGPIVLGIGGHMLNAIFVAVVFVALMRVLRNPPGALILGASYGAALWALQRYVFLPINTPEDRLFTTGLISPLWVWWIAHLALGTTIGLVYMLLERRAPAMAMPYRAHVVPVEATKKVASCFVSSVFRCAGGRAGKSSRAERVRCRGGRTATRLRVRRT